jgi:hypothetical protein
MIVYVVKIVVRDVCGREQDEQLGRAIVIGNNIGK